MTAPSVFISYSQDSDEHNARILELANRLRADGIDATIDQYEASPAEGWPKWMDRHIAKDDFVLVVCTETYYRRVMGEEEKGKGRGIKWESTLTYQHIYDNDSLNTRFIPILFDGGKTENVPSPLKGATFYFLPAQYQKLYRRLSNQLEMFKPELGKLKSLPPRERKTDYLGIRISLAKLPSTSPDLFGREKELALLDAGWNSNVIANEVKQSPDNVEIASAEERHLPMTKVNVLTLVAWGGVGKSALVNKWLSQMARDNYRGAERVFGWSFYSQGAAEGRQVSADQFIASALAWFGDPEMANSAASAWDKGERLAELVKQSRTLLILDGLEPLQNPPPVETGRIQDPALVAFLRELARQNRGLVVITTRLGVDNLKDFITREGSVIERDLDNLSPEAGAAYLSHLGVDVSDAERQGAAGEFGGHALALTLMGRYLVDVFDGDVRKRDLIPHLTDEEEKGGHAKRIMRAYEKWFEGKPERDLLTLMGLFDRPAEMGALDALLATPVIDGLTNKIQGLPAEKYKLVLKHLRKARLLTEQDPHEPEALDCHPLLREHFGEQLKEANPSAWREGNNRLYEYYKTSAKELPDTLQEMAPLFAAVLHGCQAGKYQEVFFKVYYQRIQRGGRIDFCIKQLGAVGADLAALSSFFDVLWSRPVDGLRDGDKGTVLNCAGLRLRSLGRLTEAAQPTQASLNVALVQNNWWNAAQAAENLSELYLIIGNVTQALTYAEQSVQLADRSKDAFRRMAERTTLADALHQAGRLLEAHTKFREAEEMQKSNQPKFSILYSLQGYQYCDLLLSHGNYTEVEQRASQTLKWAMQYLQFGGSILSIAMDNLSLGRAHLFQSQREPNHPFTESITYLNRAVNDLRQAGTQNYLPRGLLARAEFYRVTRDLKRAENDLDEAFTIATRGGMGLYLADYHLEYSRLYSAKGDKAKAREHWEIAKDSIDKMGYHRRDKEVQELEEQLE